MYNDDFYDVLSQRASLLRDKITFLEGYVEMMPELRIRTSVERGKLRYYYKNNSSDKYKYVSNTKEIHRLLVIYYAKKAIVPLKRELSHINHILNKKADDEISSILSKNSPSINALLYPDALLLSDDVYIQAFKAEKYTPKGFFVNSAKHFSLSGKRVRSKSEGNIVDCLEARNIPFQYEYPINIDGVCFHPDFRVLRIRDRQIIYWEHWGSMDDPEYVADQLNRLEEYKKVGIELGKNLFVTMESSMYPLNVKMINDFIDSYLI